MQDKTRFDIISQKVSGLRAKRAEILKMEPEKALDAIIEDPESVPIIHSMPVDDFYILMHEVGVNDFLPVLAMASERQWQHVLDMEIWEKDRLSIDSMTKWMDILMKADAQRLYKWLMNSGLETSEYYLNRNIELVIREHDQDSSDFDDGFNTFDDVFYFRTRPPEYYGGAVTDEASCDRDVIIDLLLRGFASVDYQRFQAMLLESDAILASEIEEALYKDMMNRLMDHGFVPFEEALSVYQPLAGWETPESGARRMSGHHDESVLSLYPSIIAAGSGFFRDLPISLEKMDLPDEFGNEMAALCNKIAVSDQKNVRTRDDLRQVVAKACGYITLGMAKIAEASGMTADSILTGYHLNYLFRAGYSRVASLQQAARDWVKISWFKRCEIPLSFWGEEWMGALGGLLLKRPLFFCNYESGLLYRDFRHEDEVRKTKAALDSMMVMDEIFSNIGVSIPWVSGGSSNGILIQAVPLIMTMWANDWLGRAGEDFFIPLEEFGRFFEALMVNGELSSDMKEAFVDWLSSLTKIRLPEIFEKKWFVFESIFSEIHNELKYVESEDLDPRFIKAFYLV